ncbi:hypothetical protein MUN88_16520 [Gracilibacillus caseinilyticus]|uniref:Uncharacterized protein n=1 Tax=Gracilibacillus caseinilyticus TaxID=2932256 RepID=A0ABY4EUZ9_9BACI|nr:hypothetical protein [Gracilibacillus caseinilyticus]UOQ47642.1 hypothetical protein MUN88_16520 [Gracilibacillus caseinilyticus]
MKYILGTVLITCMIIGGALTTHVLKSNTASSGNTFNPEVHADFPTYDAKRLLGKTELIALVEPISNQQKEIVEGMPKATLSKLKVKKNLYGESESTITLDQAINPVEIGKDYLLFLKEENGLYYLMDGNSLIQSKNGKFKVKTDGLEGTYTSGELDKKVKIKLKDLEEK